MTAFLKTEVLNAIADLYESVESILPHIQVVPGLSADASQEGEAVQELVSEGLA
jgi:hypothetical protein